MSIAIRVPSPCILAYEYEYEYEYEYARVFVYRYRATHLRQAFVMIMMIIIVSGRGIPHHRTVITRTLIRLIPGTGGCLVLGFSSFAVFMYKTYSYFRVVYLSPILKGQGF